MFFLFFLVIQFFLFFTDMCLTALYTTPIFPCTVAGLLVGCYATISYAECVLLIMPALLHGLFLYGITGAFLYIAGAAIFLLRWILLHAQHQELLLYSLIGLYGSYTLHQLSRSTPLAGLILYTIVVFGAIVSLMNFSLKWLIAVKRGNRL